MADAVKYSALQRGVLEIPLCITPNASKHNSLVLAANFSFKTSGDGR
jgi:hypothetical protein